MMKSPAKLSEIGTCAGVSRMMSVCEPPARALASAISAPVSTCQIRKVRVGVGEFSGRTSHHLSSVRLLTVRVAGWAAYRSPKADTRVSSAGGGECCWGLLVVVVQCALHPVARGRRRHLTDTCPRYARGLVVM